MYQRRLHGGKICAVLLMIGFMMMSIFNTPDSASAASTNPNYRAYADAGMVQLQSWYNSSNGQFNTTGWWNSANALGTVIDYSARTNTTTYTGDIANTFNTNASGSFLNNYYDDEGWWALTWINAYDLTHETRYLDMAKTIFHDITGGWDTTCGGGVWWSKDRTYKNAIPNELFLSIATRLHQRTPGDSGSGSYIDWATKEWSWFKNSGMINSANLINDGLTSSCQNNNDTTWTYNQGVILAGLADLYKITNDATYLTQAQAIADAAIHTLVNANGILVEPCEASGCGGDGPQFKGIFARNLYYLYQTAPKATYLQFILNNASSIWNNASNASSQFGLHWAGPFDRADAARQSSALDAINAAIPFSGNAPLPTDLAKNRPATADSSCSSNEGPEKAVDGTVFNDSKWCSGGTNGQYWLKVDLGTNTSVARFVINHAGAGGESAGYNTRDFSIQLSLDGTNWQTVVNVTGNTSSVTTHQINPQVARYVRLVITNPQTSTQYIAARIYELQVYGI